MWKKFLSRKFLLAFATGVTGMLVVLGYLSLQEQTELVQAIEKIVGGIVTIVAIVTYIVAEMKLDLKGQDGYIGS